PGFLRELALAVVEVNLWLHIVEDDQVGRAVLVDVGDALDREVFAAQAAQLSHVLEAPLAVVAVDPAMPLAGAVVAPLDDQVDEAVAIGIDGQTKHLRPRGVADAEGAGARGEAAQAVGEVEGEDTGHAAKPVGLAVAVDVDDGLAPAGVGAALELGRL